MAAECIINKSSDSRVNASDGNVNDINAATRAGNIYALLIRTAGRWKEMRRTKSQFAANWRWQKPGCRLFLVLGKTDRSSSWATDFL